MKCVILAGGVGSRLFEETKIKPKPLVEIGRKPILQHIIKYIASSNIKEFIICLGYKGNLIKDYFVELASKKYSFKYNKKDSSIIFLNKDLKNVKITFIKTGLNTGTGGRLLKIKNKLKQNDNFMMIYGDGLHNIKIDKLIKQHNKTNAKITMCITRPKNRFGLAYCRGTNLVSFNEKKNINKNDNNWINAGVFVINYEVLNYIPNFSTFFEHAPIQKFIKLKKVKVFKHSGFWACMDTLKDKIELNKLYKKNPEGIFN
jgi:glucose-1-phosphate cytidylyltransferase